MTRRLGAPSRVLHAHARLYLCELEEKVRVVSIPGKAVKLDVGDADGYATNIDIRLELDVEFGLWDLEVRANNDATLDTTDIRARATLGPVHVVILEVVVELGAQRRAGLYTLIVHSCGHVRTRVYSLLRRHLWTAADHTGHA